jgi:hypothetical protein
MMRENLLTFVYAIRCGEWIKVGVAANIEQRLGGMRVNCPYPLELVGSRRFDKASTALRVERALHLELAEQLHFGEWFRPRPIDPVQALAAAYRLEGLEPVETAIDPRRPFSVFPQVESRPATYEEIFGFPPSAHLARLEAEQLASRKV